MTVSVRAHPQLTVSFQVPMADSISPSSTAKTFRRTDTYDSQQPQSQLLQPTASGGLIPPTANSLSPISHGRQYQSELKQPKASGGLIPPSANSLSPSSHGRQSQSKFPKPIVKVRVPTAKNLRWTHPSHSQQSQSNLSQPISSIRVPIAKRRTHPSCSQQPSGPCIFSIYCRYSN